MSTLRRILVTGSRHWTDRATVEAALRSAATGPGPSTVVVGDARGADAIATEVARQLGQDVEVHRADWETHGKAAGPIRNAEMVALGADLCLAFALPGSRGTWDCVSRARAAGILTVVRQPADAQVTG